MGVFSSVLGYLAKLVINKHKPFVIGITGSVGKTTTRQMIASVLAQNFSVRTSKKNFNNEIGLPLSILGVNFYPSWNPLTWLGIFFKFVKEYFNSSYPNYLILEYGVDKVGDMDYLLSIAVPNWSVLTGVGVSHLEFFPSLEKLISEKTKLAQATKDLVFINSDNEASANLKLQQLKVITYGLDKKAEYTVSNVKKFIKEELFSTFDVLSPKQVYSLKGFFLGRPHLYASVVAVAIAEKLGLSFEQIGHGISNYKPSERRLEIKKGKLGSVIIDDSYNAAPDSMKEAINLLLEFAGKKVAILGDMRELGDISDSAHRDLGKIISKAEIQTLLTVGQKAKLIAETAQQYGYQGLVSSFDSWNKALEFLLKQVDGSEVILIKGSNALHLDMLVKALI